MKLTNEHPTDRQTSWGYLKEYFLNELSSFFIFFSCQTAAEAMNGTRLPEEEILAGAHASHFSLATATVEENVAEEEESWTGAAL